MSLGTQVVLQVHLASYLPLALRLHLAPYLLLAPQLPLGPQLPLALRFALLIYLSFPSCLFHQLPVVLVFVRQMSQNDAFIFQSLL